VAPLQEAVHLYAEKQLVMSADRSDAVAALDAARDGARDAAGDAALDAARDPARDTPAGVARGAKPAR
jgi:hypothetical protein